MDTTRHIEVCALLRRAESAARDALNGDQAAARTTLALVADARQRAEDTGSGLCGHPDCRNELHYVGRGRRPLYCSAVCRTDVYQATQMAARALIKAPESVPAQT
ncbi:hypothetical protein OG413_18395 [Streptomyces sp. NBC_01433]|uniref:hypothetical protein n=1 Tax=Streptomyces sp. NBC_01433 TaxID=2903864 RepID=UPI002254A0BE|nr:hypothetical protein [Streptomyces sp. NBC_01433]MCX4677247.1 hypothetical protein [Streptomyces sp. NBC_01433]